MSTGYTHDELYFVGLSTEDWKRERESALQQIRMIRGGISIRGESSLLPDYILEILDANPPR